EYSQFLGIEKGVLLQEARVEATEIFFAVTKLFQSRDLGLRRMVYLIIKELSPSSDEIPPNEPYRVICGDVRDKLYNTCKRARQLLANGTFDIPEETTFTNVGQVLSSEQPYKLQSPYGL
ncbi:hypothetical protein HN51_069854, partial [Arachis hypogaea]